VTSGTDIRLECSCIVIHYGDAEMTSRLVDGLLRYTTADFEIIVVDNAAPVPWKADGEDPRVRLSRLGTNTGYSNACNHGASIAYGRNLMFLNNDVEVHSDAVTALLRMLESEKAIGMVGPMLRNSDGSYQHSWGERLSLRTEFFQKCFRERQRRRGERIADSIRHHDPPLLDVDWLTCAAILVPREVFDVVGGFDGNFVFYFEDVDLSMRVAEHGYRVCFTPSCEMVHLGGGTRMQSSDFVQRGYRMGQLRAYARHTGRFQFSLLKLYLLAKFGIHACLCRNRRDLFRDIYRGIFESSLTSPGYKRIISSQGP
jgi:GT2 family glycosyltransferase